MEINFLGRKYNLGKQKEIVLDDAQKFYVEKLENMIEKGFTYDRLFTTGHMMDDLVGTRVNKPFETSAAVYKAITAIHDNVPQADPVIYQKTADPKKRKPIIDKQLEYLFDHTDPDCKMTFLEFRQKWTGFYSLYGEAFIHQVKSFGQEFGTRNLPAALKILNPQYMKEDVDKATDTLIGWQYKDRYFSVEEIIHTKSFNPYNKWRGLSPLKPITDELQIDLATLTFNLSFFRNDARPGLILSTEKALTKEQRLQVREYWEKRHQGSRNAFLPAILESGLKAEQVMSTHTDMEFTKQKDMMRGEILGIWRVPEGMFNNVASLNYSTFMGQMRVFWIYTIVPLLGKFSEMMDLHIMEPYNDGLEFDFDLTNVPAFKEELFTKFTAAKDLWAIGFTSNEINDALQLGFDGSDKPWRDEAWVPWNMQTATNAIENPRISETVNDPTNAPAGDPGDGTVDPNNPGNQQPPKTKPKPGQPAPKKTPPAKSITTRTFKKQLILKGFLDKHGQIEGKIKAKMESYFKLQREIAMKTPPEMLMAGQTIIDWTKANEKLRKTMSPLLWEAIQHGISLGKRAAGEGKGVNEDSAMHGFQSLFSISLDNLDGINDTTKSQIKDALTIDVTGGAAASTQRDDVLAVLTANLDNVFQNATVTRSALIARTESASAMNGASHLYYEALGISKKSWVSAHDDLVRESHKECEDQGAIPSTSSFENGLMYPGDQNGDADEVCNCRCTLAPEVD